MAPRLVKCVAGALLLTLTSLAMTQFHVRVSRRLSMLDELGPLPMSPQPSRVDRTASIDDALYRSGWEYATSLPLDPEGHMHQDILGIYHHPESAAISVALQNGRDDSREACLHPYLVARLSGPAVGVVYEWTHRQRTIQAADRTGSNGAKNESTAKPVTTVMMEGFYDVPVTGVFFLEILVVLCNTYDDDMLRKTEIYIYADEIDEALAAPAFEEQQRHVMDRCIVKPQNNKLTAFGTSIVVVKAAKSTDRWANQAAHENIQMGKEEFSRKQQLNGYWVRDMNNTRQGNEEYGPLHTRYQPLECAHIAVQACTHPAASETRFDPYQFSWTLSTVDEAAGTTQHLTRRETSPQSPFHIVNEQMVMDKVRLKSLEKANETICVFGDSHGWQLKNQLPKFVSSSVVYMTNPQAHLLSEDIEKGNSTKSVAERVKQVLEERESAERHQQVKVPDCSVIITSNAHWDASNWGNPPVPVSRYERNMWKTLQNLQETFPAARIFVWSPHPCSFGPYLLMKCPSKDWRNAPYIAFYTAALQRVVAKMAAASPSKHPLYLDTTFITKPMWDYALDFAHTSSKVDSVRALYIAATILDVF
jgi:hypothetical protein